jgi:hypothetical protein
MASCSRSLNCSARICDFGKKEGSPIKRAWEQFVLTVLPSLVEVQWTLFSRTDWGGRALTACI